MKWRPRHRRTGIALVPSLNLLGIALVLVAMIASLARVLRIQEQLYDPDQIVIRISHWQLELGFREAMQEVIDAYEKLHPDVIIKQIPVTEKIYGQWVNTHLNAGTAPDLVLLGFGKLTREPPYLARFFLPLTDLADQPNPYNATNEMAAWPWRDTFVDGMRASYISELQDYFSAPTSIVTLIMFYNRDLLRRIAGSDDPPRTLEELLRTCDRIKEYAQTTGQADRLVPIASSRYNVHPLVEAYRVPFTSALEPVLDANLDGTIAHWELYRCFMTGRIGYDDPHIRGYYACVRDLSDRFNAGFMSTGREDATFMFIQQQAVMMCTGSWDATSLFLQSDFDVGVFDFPLPAPHEPWGHLVAGRRNEATVGGSGQVGVNKRSPHMAQAIDFLHFITSRRYNQGLCRRAGWLPATVGATPSESMIPFMPDPVGFSTAIKLTFGHHVDTVLAGQEWKFLSGEVDYADLGANVEAALRDPARGGDKAWADEYDNARRCCRNQDRVLAIQTIRHFTDADPRDADVNHRRALLQQMRKSNGAELKHRFEALRGISIDELVE